MGMYLSKLQEIVKDRGAWCAEVYGVAKSWTWLSNWTTQQQTTVSSWAPDFWVEFHTLSHLELTATVPKPAPLSQQHYRTQTLSSCLLRYFLFGSDCLLWPVCLGWPYMAWLIVSLSYMRLWSMRSNWLGFCDYAFQSVCPLMETDKRLMEVSWWERLTERETGSCSDGWGHAQ